MTIDSFCDIIENETVIEKPKFNNVLSTFDGISCGQIALNKCGIKYDNYYASEIDNKAISVTQSNYPNTIQLGDVTTIKGEELPSIYLLLGGSPCQGFSFAGKQLNFNDPRSKLFFEFVRLIKECKPKYFLLENVVMKKQYEHIITKYLGVEPVRINSSLVSAQNRKRLYWANFPIKPPEYKEVFLKDVLDDLNLDNKTFLEREKLHKARIVGKRVSKYGKAYDYDKSLKRIQCIEVNKTNTNKSNCLTTFAKDNVLTTLEAGRYLHAFKNKHLFRYYTRSESCRLQTIPENYFDIIERDDDVRTMIGNSWTVDVIVHIFNCLSRTIYNKKQLESNIN